MFACWGPLGEPLEALLGLLGGLEGRLKVILGVAGRLLGDSEPSWTVLEASWGTLGALWGP